MSSLPVMMKDKGVSMAPQKVLLSPAVAIAV